MAGDVAWREAEEHAAHGVGQRRKTPSVDQPVDHMSPQGLDELAAEAAEYYLTPALRGACQDPPPGPPLQTARRDVWVPRTRVGGEGEERRCSCLSLAV